MLANEHGIQQKIWLLIAAHMRGGRLYVVKFIYSEKATKFFEISTLLLSYVVPVKSKVKISQNFVAFSRIYELYMGRGHPKTYNMYIEVLHRNHVL